MYLLFTLKINTMCMVYIEERVVLIVFISNPTEKFVHKNCLIKIEHTLKEH
jgi:hypothetical protein